MDNIPLPRPDPRNEGMTGILDALRNFDAQGGRPSVFEAPPQLQQWQIEQNKYATPDFMVRALGGIDNNVVRQMGLDQLKSQMWRNLGLDPVASMETYDDSPTIGQESRDYAARSNGDLPPSVDQLKNLEQQMELQDQMSQFSDWGPENLNWLKKPNRNI